LTWPLPTETGCCGAPAGVFAGCELENGLENWLSVCCTLEQAPSSGVPRMRPSAVRRVAREPEAPDLKASDIPASSDMEGLSASAMGSNAPTIASLSLGRPKLPGISPSSVANLKFPSVSRHVRYRDFKFKAATQINKFTRAPLIPKFASEVAAMACELRNRSSSAIRGADSGIMSANS